MGGVGNTPIRRLYPGINKLSTICVYSVDASESASRGDKSAGQSKGKKSKDGKESRSSKNQSGSRPASQQQNFDTTKPHWTLRIVTDASLSVSVPNTIQLIQDLSKQPVVMLG